MKRPLQDLGLFLIAFTLFFGHDSGIAPLHSGKNPLKNRPKFYLKKKFK